MEYLGNKAGTGLSLGKCLIINDKLPNIKNYKLVSNEEKETNFKEVISAFNELIQEYDNLKGQVKDKEIASLMDFYKMMLLSEGLKTRVNELINSGLNNLKAVQKTFEEKEKELSMVDNPYLKERSSDIDALKNRIIKKLLNINEVNLLDLKDDVILVAHDLSPAILLSDTNNKVKGIISEIGSKTSHVAIIANSLGIPSVFGIKEVLKTFKNDELLFVDGNKGSARTDLTDEFISNIKVEMEKEKKLKQELLQMVDKKAVTKDKKKFEVAANAGDLNELDKLMQVNSDGVGLFRTEFLFLNRNTEPSEEELFNAYKLFASKLKDKPLIIRTLDIGGDKKTSYIKIDEEENPFLGYRAIRYCLGNKEFFKVSLRAILRASHYGNVMIMYPMISSLEEIEEANSVLKEAMMELKNKNIPFNENIKVGIMVEIPSTATISDMLIDSVDFFSIGTNDLVQYTLAVDRVNPKVSKLYNYFNPGVIRLIKHTIEVTKKNKTKFTGMCGEMAADPLGIILLIGLDLDEFSVNTGSVLKVKKLISLIEYKKAKQIVKRILKMKYISDIESTLESYAKEAYGKYY